MARLGARSVVCPWGFREFGLGGEERGGRGRGAAWSDVVARLLACRRRYVDGDLVRPSVALVDLGVGGGLYNDASPKPLRAKVRSGPARHDVPSNKNGTQPMYYACLFEHLEVAQWVHGRLHAQGLR